jgi:Family of unknown function (DUF6335)
MAKKRTRKPQAKAKSTSRGSRKRPGQARSKAHSKARSRAGSKARPSSRPKKAGAARRRRVAASKPRGKAARKATPAAEPRRLLRLDRDRKQLRDPDEATPGPPSSLNLDQSASAAKSGRREFQESIQKHTETSPALTAGDVDADWEEAYSVGDEAPGGDNPTPDQDRVDDIGRALGIEYEDNEELKGAPKIEKRDRNRWELDPASAEDYTDRDEE